jgi:hypothetical protein|tara:strand:- start:2090 stop:2683 length:594 start_codon:yes stop_codon:yes gene_type:complete
MNDPFESYKLYNALKLHFETDGYDAIKYHFKTSVKPTSFFNRKDKYFFAKLANTYENELKEFYVANFKNDVKYVGDMLNEGGERYYRDHKKVMESLTYQFQTDINKLNDMDIPFDSLLEAEDNSHPLIIKLWMQEEILLETVVILDSILGFVERENKKITDTIIWPEIYRKIMKYRPFVKFDRNKCLNLLKETFTKP